MCLRVTVSGIDSSAGSENVRESERALYERERKIVQCQLENEEDGWEIERVNAFCVSHKICAANLNLKKLQYKSCLATMS